MYIILTTDSGGYTNVEISNKKVNPKEHVQEEGACLVFELIDEYYDKYIADNNDKNGIWKNWLEYLTLNKKYQIIP